MGLCAASAPKSRLTWAVALVLCLCGARAAWAGPIIAFRSRLASVSDDAVLVFGIDAALLFPVALVEWLVLNAILRLPRSEAAFRLVFAVNALIHVVTGVAAIRFVHWAVAIPFVLEPMLFVLLWERLFSNMDTRRPSLSRVGLAVTFANVVSLVLSILVLYVLAPCPRPYLPGVKADMRSVATGLAAYAVDWETYPPSLACLTTPVQYRGALPPDTTTRRLRGTRPSSFRYLRVGGPELDESGWFIWAAGPDMDHDLTNEVVPRIYDPLSRNPSDDLLRSFTYDTTNGSESNGDLWRYAGQ